MDVRVFVVLTKLFFFLELSFLSHMRSLRGKHTHNFYRIKVHLVSCGSWGTLFPGGKHGHQPVVLVDCHVVEAPLISRSRRMA